MELIVASGIAFVSTNIDDLFLLTLFYANIKFKEWEIITGQYLGIIFLIVVSLIGSFAELFIDVVYIGLLGSLEIDKKY